MNNEILSIIINSCVFLVFLILAIILIYKVKVEYKGYKYLFVTYLIFWVPLMMTREYSGSIQNKISPDWTWLVLSSYGIVGVFCRPLVDYLSIKLKNRKIILYSAVVVTLVTFIPFIAAPNTITSVLQSVGIGIGASMIGTYELLFKEQYTENKSYLTVSILAMPPLLADFLTSPIQSAITTIPVSANQSSLQQFPTILIWAVSLIFLIITFVMLFFVKEDRSKIGFKKEHTKIMKTSPVSILWVSMVCFLGFAITFVKFSNSGSIALTNLESMNEISPGVFKINQNVLKSIKGYISLIFSVFQFLSSFLIYFLLVKHKKVRLTFSLAIGSWLIYHLTILFVYDPIAYFALASLNGLAYGLIYNLFLALILDFAFETSKVTPMGIYQGILSIGTATSTFLTTFIKNNLKNDYKTTNAIINIVILVMLVIISVFYVLSEYMKKDIFYEKTNQKTIYR